MKSNLSDIAINTVTGRRVFPFAMTADQVEIETIAHHLAVQARWQGATKHPTDPTKLMLSVAEHSVQVMHEVVRRGRPDLALQALLHDATEAYVPDLIRPLKYSEPFRQPFCELEDHIWSAVAEHFNLPVEMDPLVKEADDAVCWAEWNQVVPRLEYREWSNSKSCVKEPAPIVVQMNQPYKACLDFLSCFMMLTGKIVKAA